jgi:hypothetical protein
VGTTGITGSPSSWAGASCPAPTFLAAVAPNGAPDCRDLSETTLAPPVARTVSIPLTHFRPMSDASNEAMARPAWIMRILTARGLTRSAATQADTMTALLPLPHGAILRSVSCRIDDTIAGDVTGGYVGMTLLRTTAGGIVTYCGVATTVNLGLQTLTLDAPGACGAAGSFAAAAHASITPAYTTYSVSIGTGNSTSAMELRHCEVTFDVTRLVP